MTEIVYWDCNKHAERLYYETKDEAIEAYLDDVRIEEFPEKLIVYGWAHMEPSLRDGDTLEGVLDSLDETFGDPDGGPSDITPRMKEAEKEFHRIVLEEYTPWMCERVCEEEVDVKEWVREHRPDWVKGGV